MRRLLGHTRKAMRYTHSVSSLCRGLLTGHGSRKGEQYKGRKGFTKKLCCTRKWDQRKLVLHSILFFNRLHDVYHALGQAHINNDPARIKQNHQRLPFAFLRCCGSFHRAHFNLICPFALQHSCSISNGNGTWVLRQIVMERSQLI